MIPNSWVWDSPQKMVPLILCGVSCGKHVYELDFGVNVFHLDFGVQIDSIEQPVKGNSVGSGNMSHCRASSLYDHFDHCFVFFANVQLSFQMRRFCSCDNVLNFSVTASFWCWSLCFGYHFVLDFSALDQRPLLFDSDLSLLDRCSLKKATLLSPHPTDRERDNPSMRNLHPKRQRPIPLNTHPTYGNKCSTSQDTQDSSRNVFLIFKVTCKIRKKLNRQC